MKPTAASTSLDAEIELLFADIDQLPVGERFRRDAEAAELIAGFRAGLGHPPKEPGACTKCGRDGCDDPEHLPPQQRGQQSDASSPQRRRELEFLTVAELAARVAKSGPRRWLLRGLWPAGDYGIFSAEKKAQKTWATVDLAVSTAACAAWLGRVPIDEPGPVLMFCGEGGPPNILRRIRAVAEARGLVAEALEHPLIISPRAPHLKNAAHLDLMAQRIEAMRPSLVTLDPLYLSARGAKGSDLYAMGELLETVQQIVEPVGASLWVVTHNNRNRDGRGADRISGAGPAEWGRVLITATVVSRHTDQTTKASTVITELDFIGGEIPDQQLRVARRVWAEDPDDLASPLHMEMLEVKEMEDRPAGPNLPPATQKLVKALAALDRESDSQTLVDEIVRRWGHPLRRETVSRSMADLEERGFVAPADGVSRLKLWRITDAGAALAETLSIPGVTDV